MSAPLSGFAIAKISDFDWSMVALLSVIAGLMLSMITLPFLFAGHESEANATLYEFGVWALYSLLFTPILAWWKRRRDRFIRNVDAQEYELGREITIAIRALVERFHNDHVTFPPETYRVFRVEHVASADIRGDFDGKWWGFVCGGLEGKINARSTPDLIDLSTVMKLVDGDGETVRVIIPSWQATAVAYTSTIDFLTQFAPDGTHQRVAIEDMRRLSVKIRNMIIPTAVIDKLDFVCREGSVQRPVVRVLGRNSGPGIVTALALEVDGVQYPVFPLQLLKGLRPAVIRPLNQLYTFRIEEIEEDTE